MQEDLSQDRAAREEMTRQLEAAEADLKRSNEEKLKKEQEWKLEQAKLDASKKYLEQRVKALTEAMGNVLKEMESVEGQYLSMKAEHQNRSDSLVSVATNTDLMLSVLAPRSQVETEAAHNRMEKSRSLRSLRASESNEDVGRWKY